MKITLAVAALIIATLGLGSATVEQHAAGPRHVVAGDSPDDLGWGSGSVVLPPAA